ncbi:hypothetical protein I3F58_22290, partial [Streptomyces sp. MUM 203J]|nr:hypothetical protein [Streptomyces sp. MUM 203J]
MTGPPAGAALSGASSVDGAFRPEPATAGPASAWSSSARSAFYAQDEAQECARALAHLED